MAHDHATDKQDHQCRKLYDLLGAQNMDECMQKMKSGAAKLLS